MRVRGVGAVVTGLVVATVLSACAPVAGGLSVADGPPGVGANPITWQDVQRDGLGGARLALLVSPYDAKAGHPARLGLVDEDGTTRFLDLDADPEAELGGRRGILCAQTADAALRIDGRGAERHALPGPGGYGHATTVRADGSCVRVMSGGVAWEQDGRGMTTGAWPALPEATAVSEDAVWVATTDGDEPGTTVTLLRTDLTTGRTETVSQWPTLLRREPDGRRLSGDLLVSELFRHDGRLHHLVEVSARSGDDEPATIRPGVKSEVHLVSIDPRTGRRESTALFVTRAGVEEPSEAGAHVPQGAHALFAGHLHDGSIFAVDADGEILAIDLGSRSVRVTGRLSPRARAASDLVATWAAGSLTVVVRGESGRVTAQDYDLATGRLRNSTTLSGLRGVLSTRTFVSSLAVVG
ncbi:hypothetical protein [Aeromicrobium duanguangcaii]|uniref:hypothetical protein n=1 Tax=Aeromicrobium duanguangcaii TaxID=2968086 RepID=UPI002017F950|nr:hypothetical protein [Aeromicrobium duanguangcaii]MCL3837997.1 hypothetical protein [Aeromicrobium duanguangcaii]